MRVDYSRTYNAKWDHDNQTWWERRSKLEKTIIMLLIVIGISFCGAVMFSIYRNSDDRQICDTSSCLLAASEIARHLDTDVDPCQDFFKFSCGSFIKNMEKKASHKTYTEELVELQLEKIITEDINSNDHFMITKQKEFYQKCMNETATETESLNIFKETLEEINNGWPVVVGYQWKAQQFDWMDMIFELRNRGYFHSMMLQVNLIQDPLDSNQFIFNIKPPETNKMKKEFRAWYKNYMVKVAVFFGAENKLATFEMDDVIDFMLKLENIAEKNKWIRDPNEKYNWTEEIFSTRITVQEFQDNHNEIDWLYFLNNLVHPSTILSWDDYVIFPKSKYIEDFFYTIHKTPRRVQANYIIWKVLENTMPFMPEELKELERNYTCISNQGTQVKSRHDFCKNLTYLNFYLDPSEITYARNYLPTETRNAVLELVDTIKQDFINNLNENSLMDDVSKERAVERANSIMEVVGMQGDYYNDTIFEIYEDIYSTNESDNFFATLLSLSKLHTDLTYFLYNKPVNATILYQFASQTEVRYSNVDNAIVVPAGILQGIYYDEDKPMFQNYGGIGMMIGRELVKGFYKDVTEINVEDNINDIWTNVTKHTFMEEIQCLDNNFKSFYIRGNNSEVDSLVTVETIDDYIGIEIVYSAYKIWIAQNGEEPYLPGLNYSPAQLFWISSLLPLCYNLNEEQNNSENEIAFSSILLAVSNNPDFLNDFQCTSSEKSCSLF